MSIRVACSACQTAYILSEDLAGKKVSCKKCQALLRVPPRFPTDRAADSDEDRSSKAGEERASSKKTPPPLPPRDENGPRRKENERKGRTGPRAPTRSRALLWGSIAGGACVAAGLVLMVVLLNRPEGTPKGPDPRAEAPKEKPVPPPDPKDKTTVKVDAPDRKRVEIVPIVLKGADKRIELPPPTDGDRPLLGLDAGGPTAMVKASLFHPNGREVITVCEDRTVRRWDLATGETIQVYRFPMGPGPEGALRAGDISPDGRWLAVSGYPFGGGKFGVPIYLLSLETGQVATHLEGHKDVVGSLAFSHSGRLLGSGSHDGTCRLHDLEAGGAIVLAGHRQPVRRLAFSRDDRLVASVAQDRTVRIWSAADGAGLAELNDFPGEPLSVAWHPQEDTLAVGCVDGTIKLFSAAGMLQRDIRIDPKDNIQSVAIAYSPDGEEILYGGVSAGGRVGLVHAREGKARLVFKGHENTVLDARFSADGKLAITTGGDDNETLVWKVADGSVVHVLKGEGKAIWALGWRKDGSGFAWGHTNRDHALARAPLEYSFQFDEMALSPPPDDNYGRIAARHGPWEIRQLDFTRMAILKDGKPLHEFKVAERNRIYAISMMPGNRALVGTASTLDLVDLAGNRVIRSYRGHNGIVLTVSPSPDGRHFLSGSVDQTICLWDPERTEPLATFFPAGRDWIAWTPQGYYACSALGERLMGWQVNHGPHRLASFHPAARFRASLFQPELMRHVYQQKSLEKALALASKEKAVSPVEVTAVLPPTVAIVAPAGAARTFKEATTEVKMKVRSSGAHAVTAVRLLVDGRPVLGEKGVKRFEPPLKGETEVAWTVDLLPGKHVLHGIAESPVSKSLSAPVEVARVGAKDEELPKLYLLSVGISGYPGPLALQYAHKDAIVLEKTLRELREGVFGAVECKLLTDGKATRANILEGLAWLEKVTTPADVAMVFLAGHGSRDLKGEFHYIPVDIDPKDPEKTTVSGAILKEKLAGLPGRVVIILDACHSGAAEKVGRTITEGLVRDLVSEDAGVVVMCSSQGREYSLESPKLEHGLYTLGLVEGLTGGGDYNRDSYIYIHEVNIYAHDRVRRLSLGMQNPALGRPLTLRSFPLAKVK